MDTHHQEVTMLPGDQLAQETIMTTCTS